MDNDLDFRVHSREPAIRVRPLSVRLSELRNPVHLGDRIPHCTHTRCVRNEEGRHDQRSVNCSPPKRTTSRTDRDCLCPRHCHCGLRHITVMDLSLSRELKNFSSDPIEWAISIRERWAERSEHRSKGSHGPDFMPWPPCPYAIDDEWEAKLHEAIGAPWPCPAQERFEAMWWEVIASVQARVRDVGRGAFGKESWADGDTALARIVYCMTLHLQPEHLLETGVARHHHPLRPRSNRRERARPSLEHRSPTARGARNPRSDRHRGS